MKIRYALLLIYAATALLAIAVTPRYEEAGVYAFEDPAKISNSLLYFGIILGFTAFLLVLAKWSFLLQKLMYLLILVSIYYVLLPFFGLLSILLAFLLLIMLIKKSNWLTIDISAFLLAAGITSIFGLSLEPLPIIVLLVILAFYDAISVYKTGHMVSLADTITKLKLPMLFIIPCTKNLDYSNPMEAKGKAVFMGLGDVIVPNMLVVSAQVFSDSPYIGFLKISALFTLVGGVFGLLLLVSLMGKRLGAHPGLPLLNAGAITGYLASFLF